FGEVILQKLNIPTKFGGGFHTIGITVLVLFIVSLYLLLNSICKHRIKAVLLYFLILGFTPWIIVSLFKSTLAKGFFALSNEVEKSSWVRKTKVLTSIKFPIRFSVFC